MLTQTNNQSKNVPMLKEPEYNGAKPISANRYIPNPNRPFLVKGLLLEGQVGMIAGEPNLGKSAIMACIASHVAMGRDIGDMKVNRAAVLYLAAEDPEGILERAYPFMHDAPVGAATFDVLEEVPDFTNKAEVDKFKKYASEFQAYHNCERMLIVVDTLNLSIGDADENSARDMSKVFKHAQHIAKATGAHVLFIHHVGTNDKGRPRGSSAMTANLDTLLTLEKAEDAMGNAAMMIQKKQKRIRKGNSLAFRVEAFDAGVDDDGDAFTVPMAVTFRHDKSLIVSSPAHNTNNSKPSAAALRVSEVFKLMRSMAAKNTQQWFSPKEISEFVGGPFNSIKDNPDALRKAIGRALTTLEKSGSLQRNDDGLFSLPKQSASTVEIPPVPTSPLH